ncbi:MAG: hypothetical protein M0036_25795 [Desulfobacteraceae bacterium]|nr:hypothetical protein [Desulfobacteraceae bacterium]
MSKTKGGRDKAFIPSAFAFIFRADSLGLPALTLPVPTHILFDDFIARLQIALTAGHKVKQVWSVGAFNDASATLAAVLIDIQLR